MTNLVATNTLTSQFTALPESWTPTQQGCLQTSDYWLWQYGSPTDIRPVLGGPSQTSECFPYSTFDETQTYAGSTCPPQYSSACQATNDIKAVTCCPTLYNFTCVASTLVVTANRASAFRCVSAWSTSTPIALQKTDLLSSGPVSVVSTAMSPNLHVFALPIILAITVRLPDMRQVFL